jgi:hypothetical protein
LFCGEKTTSPAWAAGAGSAPKSTANDRICVTRFLT